MPLLLRWRARLVPESLGLGWMPFFTLGYLAFLFMPFMLGWLADGRGGWIGEVSEVLWPTLLSIAIFLPLYFASYRFEFAGKLACMLAIAGIGYALMPVNPFANAYTIYAIGFAAGIGKWLWSRMAWAWLVTTWANGPGWRSASLSITDTGVFSACARLPTWVRWRSTTS